MRHTSTNPIILRIFQLIYLWGTCRASSSYLPSCIFQFFTCWHLKHFVLFQRSPNIWSSLPNDVEMIQHAFYLHRSNKISTWKGRRMSKGNGNRTRTKRRVVNCPLQSMGKRLDRVVVGQQPQMPSRVTDRFSRGLRSPGKQHMCSGGKMQFFIGYN